MSGHRLCYAMPAVHNSLQRSLHQQTHAHTHTRTPLAAAQAPCTAPSPPHTHTQVCRCVPFIHRTMKLEELVSVRDIRGIIKDKFKQFKGVTDPRVSGHGAGVGGCFSRGWWWVGGGGLCGGVKENFKQLKRGNGYLLPCWRVCCRAGVCEGPPPGGHD